MELEKQGVWWFRRLLTCVAAGCCLLAGILGIPGCDSVRDTMAICKFGAIVNAAEAQDKNCLENLLRKGVSIDTREPVTGITPLHLVVDHGNEAGIRMLLEYGANPKARSLRLDLPLHELNGNGDEKKARTIAELLLGRGAKLNATDSRGHTTLHKALLLGRYDSAEALIALGINLNLQGPGVTPLHTILLKSSPGSPDLRMIRQLVEAGANVNATTTKGSLSALHLAVAGGNAEVVSMLLEKGADLNARNADGLTPLQYANRYGHAEMAKVIASYGEKKGEQGKRAQR